MLVHITNPDCFNECMKRVKMVYWPYDKIDGLPDGLVELFINYEIKEGSVLNSPNLVDIDNVNMISKKTDKIILEYIERVCEEGFEIVLNNGDKHVMPFIDRFHSLFLRRKWPTVYGKPSSAVHNILSLSYFGADACGNIGNCSANEGNYWHFVNVVAVLSHLVVYFRNGLNINELFAARGEYDFIKYHSGPDVRSYKLMLGGFYHDIGKTVVDHRHAMEGYMILSSYKSKALLQFEKLSEIYNYGMGVGEKMGLDREDLLFVADLVYYHDLFGTLATGENGYMRLVNLIDRVERYSRKDAENILINEEKVLRIGKRCLFDLWLLNVADMMTSLNEKWVEHKEWTACDPGSADSFANIKKFFKWVINHPVVDNDKTVSCEVYFDKGYDFFHDLKVAFELYEIYVKDRYDSKELSFDESVKKCSYYHNVSRLRRLVKNSLFPNVCMARKELMSRKDEYDENVYSALYCFYSEILGISKYALDKTIDTAIRSGTDYAEFFKRFAWVGQLDYSLNFFRKLATYATDHIGEKITKIASNECDNDFHGWINHKTNTFGGQSDKSGRWGKANARYFVDNYVQIVVQVINHLLFRDSFYEHIINFEFEDAGNRLTDDKIKRILSFEGPARSTKAMTLILETIFIY